MLSVVLGFTGIDSVYEPPLNPDLVLKAGETSVQECVEKVVNLLAGKVYDIRVFGCVWH